MGDNLKIKDKRQRSSSSIAGPGIDGTRSERKLDIRASILEVDDQFALAEARCDDLQEKIELVKSLKRKKKLKKRSSTRVAEAQPVEEVPFITVRTELKKRMLPQMTRVQRLQPANTTRGCEEPVPREQHQTLGQLRGFNQIHRPQPQDVNKEKRMIPNVTTTSVQRLRRSRADGDSQLHINKSSASGFIGRSVRALAVAAEVASGDDHVHDFPSHIVCNARRSDELAARSKPPLNFESRDIKRKPPVINRRRHVPREVPLKAGHSANDRPVVELFYKNRSVRSGDLTRCDSRDKDAFTEESMKDKEWRPKRPKNRSRRYEQPTVASQMKQNSVRYYNPNLNITSIPFIVSKSTAPSHNIGVNIQQVLNGIKNQQPLSGIPLTIAYHMGLGHIPAYEKNMQPALEGREMNAIRLGRRLLRLPSYKYVSYNRLLALYRAGDGVVSRFLRSIDRPHRFYTSMYNLATRDDGIDDATTTRSHVKNREAKQSLAAYASLYRQYEQVDKLLQEGYDPDLERRKEELIRQLAAREDHIRKVVQEYRTSADMEVAGLRASASTADDAGRFASARLHLADSHH